MFSRSLVLRDWPDDEGSQGYSSDDGSSQGYTPEDGSSQGYSSDDGSSQGYSSDNPDDDTWDEGSNVNNTYFTRDVLSTGRALDGRGDNLLQPIECRFEDCLTEEDGVGEGDPEGSGDPEEEE